ncbi:hypothetical protein B9479_005998 [Cryptococcus floricola]|uniref:Uncharacterized protein n=1 Tax=Cryptococcus floricola TaxID=2591691 RepID=A0A5D3ARS4_9TREE|nr:hypothetical protein B9479_005998 [Cryptococcus floricola]
MSLKTAYIPCSPVNTPTLPQGTTAIPIADASLWPVGSVQSVLSFDGPLDERRLKKAVGILSGAWPTLAGRYEKVKEGEEDRFQIKLTSSPIPFETQTIERDQAFPNKQVVQPLLDPFLPHLGKDFHRPNSDAHLFALRLTTLMPSGNSVLGVEMSHVFSDGETKSKLLHLLDTFYVYGEKAVSDLQKYSGYDLPTFLPHIGPLPSYDPAWNIPGTMNEGHDFLPMIQAYTAAITQSVQVVFDLQQSELRALTDRYQEEAGIHISEADALSAWWIALMAKVGVSDVKSVIYVCSYRTWSPSHPSFPENLPTLAANVASMTHLPIPLSSSATPAAIAKSIREGVSSLRDSPEETLKWLSTAGHHLRKAAEEEKGQIYLPGENEVSINSGLRMDWSTSFGFEPYQVSFHTTFSVPRFLRIFRANPKKGEEKGERVELTFSVADEEVKKRVEQLVAEERQNWKGD